MLVKDRSFLVTGGGSGLGGACARRLIGAAASVVIADIDEQRGQSFAQELGPRALFLRTDVASEADVQAAVQTAVELSPTYGLSGVINCAGIVTGQRVLGRDGPHSLDAFVKVIEVNLIGTFNVIRLAATAMQELDPNEDDERGVIINTASVAAFEGQVGQAAYAASKGGVVSMTLPIARELAREQIRVVSIAPGLFDTPMMESFPDKVRQSLADQCLYPKRFGRPDEFAALVQHIIENPMLNGEVIRLDGAVRMAAR